MRKALGVVSDSVRVRYAQSFDGTDVLEMTFRRDHHGTVVSIPLDLAASLTTDVVLASDEGRKARAARE